MNNSIVRQDIASIHALMSDLEEKLCGSTILVTGCCGFLGYYLIEYLLSVSENLDIKVIGLDNCILNTPDWLETWKANPNFRYYNTSVESFDFDAEGICDTNYILHMASIASPLFYRQKPLETLQANLQGLTRLAELILSGRLHQYRRMVVLSSSEIYGNPDPSHIPTKEDYVGAVSCTGPRACYDESKRVCETLCYIYSHHYGMSVSTVRPFNVFGPGMRLNDARLPADVASSIINGRDIIIHSDGSPTRTFCYVSDAIVGILKTMCCDCNLAVNIGNNCQEMSVYEFAETFRTVAWELIGYQGKIAFEKSEDTQYLVHNPQRRCPDLHLANEALGYSPKVSLEEGLKKYLLFLREC